MQLFPAVTSIASDPSFSNAPDAYFGAPVNATFVAASNGVNPFSWTPFQNYSDDTLAANLAKAATGAITFPEALNQTQDADVAFAKKQGFTVT
jgi:ABC-type glycerol-3-phosphate transport system substrate-binding protein